MFAAQRIAETKLKYPYQLTATEQFENQAIVAEGGNFMNLLMKMNTAFQELEETEPDEQVHMKIHATDIQVLSREFLSSYRFAPDELGRVLIIDPIAHLIESYKAHNGGKIESAEAELERVLALPERPPMFE